MGRSNHANLERSKPKGAGAKRRPRWKSSSLYWTLASIFGSTAVGVLTFGGADIRLAPILLTLAVLFALPEITTNAKLRRILSLLTLVGCVIVVAGLTKWPVVRDKVDFVISAPQSAFGYDAKTDQTLFWIVVGVTNRGTPSAAGDWELEIESLDQPPSFQTQTVRYFKLPPYPISQQFMGRFTDEDSIYERTMQKAIAPGDAVIGWAYFQIPGVLPFEDLDKGKVMFHLICYDYLNKQHKSAPIYVGKNPAAPEYFPGVKGGFQVRPNAPKQPGL